MKDLADTSTCGYVIDVGEQVPCSCCVAAPIFDARNQLVGAIGISRCKLESPLKHRDVIRQTAVSHHLS